MNGLFDWIKAVSSFVQLKGGTPASSSEPPPAFTDLNMESTVPIVRPESNPLLHFPFDIRENLTTEYYDTGAKSMTQKYIELTYINNGRLEELQTLFNDVYFYAVKRDKHIIAYNIMVVLSQVQYCFLGSWACILAVAATRNKYLDVIEMGVRCFENWESKEACSFLRQCTFTESWLQDYANEVYEFIEEEGLEEDVLLAKNITWKVAIRGSDSSVDSAGCSGRYSSSGIQNR